MTSLTVTAARTAQGKDAGNDACFTRERPRTPPCVGLQPPQRDRGSAGDADMTLGAVVQRAWEGLRTGGVTGTSECPVCRGELRLDAGGHAARCGDCGTRLW